MIQYATERYNILPSSDGDKLSPRERITGRTIDYNYDMKSGFGTVGLFPVPLALQTIDLAERGELGIIVGNTPGRHGVCQVYIPTRKSICHRTKFKVLRIDESIRHLISRDQPRDPDLIPVEPPPQNLNILESITAPDTSTATTITTPTTSNTSDTLTINNNTLLPSEGDNTDTEPNSTIMATIVERLEPDGSVPKPA